MVRARQLHARVRPRALGFLPQPQQATRVAEPPTTSHDPRARPGMRRFVATVARLLAARLRVADGPRAEVAPNGVRHHRLPSARRRHLAVASQLAGFRCLPVNLLAPQAARPAQGLLAARVDLVLPRVGSRSARTRLQRPGGIRLLEARAPEGGLHDMDCPPILEPVRPLCAHVRKPRRRAPGAGSHPSSGAQGD
jgi:hypothetical protein